MLKIGSCTATTARVLRSAAISSSRVTATQPSTTRAGERPLIASTRIPSARSLAAPSRIAPRTYTSTSTLPDRTGAPAARTEGSPVVALGRDVLPAASSFRRASSLSVGRAPSAGASSTAISGGGRQSDTHDLTLSRVHRRGNRPPIRWRADELRPDRRTARHPAPGPRLRPERGRPGRRGARPREALPLRDRPEARRARPDGHPLPRGVRRRRGRLPVVRASSSRSSRASTRRWRSRWPRTRRSAPTRSTRSGPRSRSSSTCPT